MRYIERYALALIVGVAVGAAGLAWAADSGGGGFEAKRYRTSGGGGFDRPWPVGGGGYDLQVATGTNIDTARADVKQR